MLMFVLVLLVVVSRRGIGDPLIQIELDVDAAVGWQSDASALRGRRLIATSRLWWPSYPPPMAANVV